MLRPKFLLLDEPSAGTDERTLLTLKDVLQDLAQMNVGIILIEQNTDLALSLASSAYLLDGGKVQGGPQVAGVRELVARVSS
jgi:branched-chain amino acid transport system ATP-binding protein